MSTNTPNYQLLKPDPSENVNVVSQINDNYDTIDTELKRVDDYTLVKPIARLHQDAVQNIPATTWTSITFEVEDIDTAGGHDNSVNPSRYTSQKAGYYRCGGSVWYASDTDGSRLSRWAKNGTAVDASGTELPSDGLMGYPSAPLIIALSVSDYIELQVWQDSGGALNTVVGADYAGCSMTVEWIRPL